MPVKKRPIALDKKHNLPIQPQTAPKIITQNRSANYGFSIEPRNPTMKDGITKC
ncbi:MAG TPA: hypothetical protein VK211_18515 [Kamptonema sp.]|nr:hypothetical protein [Kamptonema sp.]